MLRFVVVCGLVLLAAGQGDFLRAVDGASTIQIERLRCEYLTNPLGLDVVQPRLDWILTSSGKSPRNLNQSSYHILVASSPELLAHDQGDLWDSGDVKSDETAHIVYGGQPLVSREICYWKVRVVDSLGHKSAWSEAASWEMGLLKPGDWQAKWIVAAKIDLPKGHDKLAVVRASYQAVGGENAKDVTDLVIKMIKDDRFQLRVTNDTFGGDPAPGRKKEFFLMYTVNGHMREVTLAEEEQLYLPEGPPTLPLLRKDFTTTKSIAKARVYVTALGLYELHLNGQRVGDHLFAPDWTEYAKRVRYQVYDVTKFVQPGTNTLGALVGDGWYSGHTGSSFHVWGMSPKLLVQLEVTYSDGSVDRIVTDQTWVKHTSPVTSSDNLMGEDYDATREVAGWDSPGLSLTDWIAVSEDKDSPELDGQIDQPVRQIGELKAKSISEPKPGHWVFDLGQNMVGFVRLKLDLPEGTQIRLRHAEVLNPDGTIYTENLRSALATDTYITKGGGPETWQPHFTFHGFRYVELTGAPDKPPLDSVTGVVIGTDIPHAGDFSCSNAAVNQLQSNIQWGMRGNYLSFPTDCPQRDERLGWMADAQVFIKTAAYNGDVSAFFTKWLIDVDDAQTPEGSFPDFVGGGHGSYCAPGWGDAGVICPWTIYLMYDDKRVLEQHLPAMKHWVDWELANSTNLIRTGNRGLDYGDWLSQGENTSKELIGTAYFAYSASLVAKACAVVNDTAGVAKYGQLFEQVKAAFNQHYVDVNGRIQDGTQTDYVMALRFDLIPTDLRPKAAQYIAESIAAHHDHLTTGFIGVSYLLPALTSEHQTDAAYRIFLQDTFPSWLFSVKHGATTIWERWDGWTPDKGFQTPGMNSFNHYSLGSCGEWMFDTVVGIGVDPKQPGFHHIVIHPQPGGDVTHAEATYDSIRGKISTKWSLINGAFSLDVTVPINATATIDLPTSNLASVKEGGKDVSNIPEIKPVLDSPGTARYLVGSGVYHFTCTP